MSITGFNRRRREIEAEKEEVREDVTEEVVCLEETIIPPIDEMTKNDIMKDLDSMKIEYNNRDTKTKLYALLCEVV